MTARSPLGLFDLGTPRGPFARMAVLSLGLHLGLLAVLFAVRGTPKIQETLASYQVSLVSLPAPSPPPQPEVEQPREPTVPPPPAPKPAPVVKERVRAAPPPARPAPAPAPPVEAAPRASEPKPAPPPLPAPQVSVKPRAPIAAPSLAAPAPGQVPRRPERDEDLGDLLRGIQAPAAPKLKEVQAAPIASPVPKDRRAEAAPALDKDLREILQKAQVPDAPAPQPARGTPAPARRRLELTKEVNERLDAAQAVVPPAAVTPVQAKPDLASAPTARTPAMAMEVPGASTAMSHYFGLIQAKISKMWTAPPVDVSGQSLRVVVRFRLHRSGTVTAVVVEQSSGNGYYDDAGLRAVKAAQPLPPFPPEFAEQSFEAHFSFTVGEPLG